MDSNKEQEVYKQAEKRVKRIKKFYNHLQVFAVVIISVLLFSNTIITFFEGHAHNPNTLKWIRANIWINALLWFIGIIIHGLVAFRYKINFIDNWEKRKVEEFMNEKE